MSPWQTPNFSASTLADQMTNFTTQWQQACQKWQSGVEGASTTPAAFWQSISSIQSAQARFVSEFFQRQPQHFTTLFQCKTFPQVVECISRWNGHNLTAAINLGIVMQAHRGSFFAQWQRQFPTTANATALANMWKSGLNTAQTATQSTAQSNNFSNAFNTNFASTLANNFANAFTSNNSSANTTKASTSSTPTAGTVSTASTATQQNATQSNPIAQATTSPTQTAQAQANQPAAQATAQIIAAPSITAHTALTQPETTEQLTLLNGTTGNAVISSTANSVMRSSTGSTIAAAAAARRSVVARRTANNRRRAPR